MKKLTAKQKKIVDIVVTCIEVVIVLIGIIISAIVISNPIISSGEVSGGKIKLMPVLSDSMAGNEKTSFKKGDLVIAKTPDDVRALAVGDIITFKYNINGVDVLNTHRIIEVLPGADGKADTYITHGDNNPVGSNETVNPNAVLAVYTTHLKGVGKAIFWLQNSTNFLLVIVLPLALLFIYNIVMFVRMLMQWKMEKVASANNGAATVDEEEIKRKAIEEYLASQAKATDKESSEGEAAGAEENKTEE